MPNRAAAAGSCEKRSSISYSRCLCQRPRLQPVGLGDAERDEGDDSGEGQDDRRDQQAERAPGAQRRSPHSRAPAASRPRGRSPTALRAAPASDSAGRSLARRLSVDQCGHQHGEMTIDAELSAERSAADRSGIEMTRAAAAARSAARTASRAPRSRASAARGGVARPRGRGRGESGRALGVVTRRRRSARGCRRARRRRCGPRIAASTPSPAARSARAARLPRSSSFRSCSSGVIVTPEKASSRRRWMSSCRRSSLGLFPVGGGQVQEGVDDRAGWPSNRARSAGRRRGPRR